MENQKISVILSAITILALSSNAYAGKIISDAVDPQNPTVTENAQFGFGGWNFDNIDIKIVNLDGTPTTNEFYDNGTYDPMSEGMSFDSDVKDIIGYSNGSPIAGTTVMAQVHGKDWPVGEPSGIKIINDDTGTKHGKPENCIMTSSYLEFQDMSDDTSGSGYLDAWPTQPNPVICSSPWQTHKRYKINLLPSTVEGITPGNWGKPVDIVFNLDSNDTEATIRRYQVLQKVNNYTGMRLDGIKIQVLDENGSDNNVALTLSLGIGEGLESGGVGSPDRWDIWEAEDMANMSHGLWGPYEVNDGVLRFDNGFFDYKRVYYNVLENFDYVNDNHTIFYIGDMLGGNYQELFGNWLPSIWEPAGIFHDDDMNPETDGILKAFLGVAPGFTERDWYTRDVTFDSGAPIVEGVNPRYDWRLATAEEIATWAGEWYSEGPIEDVLNLGLNYIINVGLNSAIGATFTLRVTPHIDTNQTPPSSYEPPVTVTMPPAINMYLLD